MCICFQLISITFFFLSKHGHLLAWKVNKYIKPEKTKRVYLDELQQKIKTMKFLVQTHPFTFETKCIPRVNYEDIQCSSNFLVSRRNPMVWPFKWNLLGSTLAIWSNLFFNILRNEIWDYSVLIFSTLGS